MKVRFKSALFMCAVLLFVPLLKAEVNIDNFTPPPRVRSFSKS